MTIDKDIIGVRQSIFMNNEIPKTNKNLIDYQGIIHQVYQKMIAYYQHDPKRINHFIKVHQYAKLIGIEEGLEPHILFRLELGALLHDIGIKVSEEKYQSSAGKYQEIEGPPLAEELLSSFNLADDLVHRVAYLVGHHHTYDMVDGLDYQILIEADFIVNLYEDNLSKEACLSVKSKYFKTATGKRYMDLLYLS